MNASFKPSFCKVAEVIIIPKPGKLPTEVKSYRPLLPMYLIKNIRESTTNNKHWFGIRDAHWTIDAVHRSIRAEKCLFCRIHWCATSFRQGQSYGSTNKTQLSKAYWTLFKSHLLNRFLGVKYEDKCSQLKKIQEGVAPGTIY